MVYFVNASAKTNAYCEIHQFHTSFGDVVEGNLHNEQEMFVM
jgi:hypothetical protein